MKKTLSIKVCNELGVLARISTLFSSRGFNIESIVVGPTHISEISRIVLVIPGDEKIVEQISKQLYKLSQVLEVKDLSDIACVERELVLIQISTDNNVRSQILEIVQIFRAKVVDISNSSITIEISGDPGKISSIQEILKNYKILQIVRTGKISIERELGINTEFLKNI